MSLPKHNEDTVHCTTSLDTQARMQNPKQTLHGQLLKLLGMKHFVADLKGQHLAKQLAKTMEPHCKHVHWNQANFQGRLR
jgi:hypothetical protein